MCGIIGYLGNKNCIDYLLSGLQKLQNRGYDSAGISIINNNNLYIKKYASTDQINAIDCLTNEIDIPESVLGIGHTRWATHGEKTDVNAHPHSDDKNRVALVHNGIIENYRELKQVLVSAGYGLQSQTDTEIIAVTIGMYLDKDFEINDAIKETLSKLSGSWALCIMHIDYPSKIWIARNGSPLLLGIEDDYIMVASESIAFGKYIQKYIVLDNNDLIEISISNNKISYANNMQRYKLKDNLSITDYELPDNYTHWMLKEIYDQPDSIEKALNNGGRIYSSTSVKLGGLDNLKHRFENIRHIILLGCGTSYHSGLWSTHLFKGLDIFDTVSCIDGAEFDINDIPKRDLTAVILLSQSGETKDLHRCIEIARIYDLLTIGVVNVHDSMIARESDCGVYLNAGRENAVASTKSFTNQCVVLSMIAIWFSQNKGTCIRKRQLIIDCLRKLSYHIELVFENICTKIEKIVHLFDNHHSTFILGKGPNEAVAKEGSLKIKEITYKHAEGYSTSALKHGPFALIETELPIILLDVDDNYREKTLNAFNEIQTRKANIIVITDKPINYHNLNIPIENILSIEKNVIFGGIISNVYIQVLSYYMSLRYGYNPDFPRNLAKVVTVE